MYGFYTFHNVDMSVKKFTETYHKERQLTFKDKRDVYKRQKYN